MIMYTYIFINDNNNDNDNIFIDMNYIKRYLQNASPIITCCPGIARAFSDGFIFASSL